MTEALNIENLSLRIGDAAILSDVSLTLCAGEITSLIGRSGSGKSMTALAIMGLAPGVADTGGAIRFVGENILGASESRLCKLRGRDIAMVFQEPMTALNPLQRIDAQVAETFLTHSDISREDALQKARETLARVGLPPDEAPPGRLPHELSGGQRQRVVIAMAIAMRPKILIADEPTTALDVTTQAEILALLKCLAANEGIAILLITHDLAVVSQVADRIAIIKEGRIVAKSDADDFYRNADSPHVQEFIPARAKRRQAQGERTPILNASKICCDYLRARHSVFSAPSNFRAVDNVSFSIATGENVGLVGESGCGKSTIAKALLGLHPIASGAVTIGGESFSSETPDSIRRLRRKIQIVFQDPYSSFNPRMRVCDIVAEPLHLLDSPMSRAAKRDRAASLLTAVGLSPDSLDKHPHAFSGGQRQRIAIARALATDPEVIVLDEATSALDIASRNRVLELLQSLSETRGVALLFITHDLSVIRDIADRVLVMRAGKIVETGATEQIFNNPAHAYTKSLVNAAPVIRWRQSASADGDIDA